MNSETNMPIGKLEKFSPINGESGVWRDEAHFSNWLVAANGLALLGDTLGAEFKLGEREKPVGRYSADVVLRDIRGRLVVVENQFGITDHNHLGKLLTYSAGLEAATIVWIAEQFRDEHRATLDWQNNQTIQDVRFFGLELRAWKIGDSPPAINFNIVSKPNDWTRVGGESPKGQSAVMEDWEAWCRPYWKGFLDFLAEEGTDLPVAGLAPAKFPYMVVGIGRTDFSLEPTITKTRGIRAALALPGWAYDPLSKDKDAIERETGIQWEWKAPGANGKAARIRAANQGFDVKNEEQLREQHQWLKKHLELLNTAFRSRIQTLSKPDE